MSPSKLLEHIHADQDDQVDSIYPLRIRELSRSHWTPVKVARLAAAFLVRTPGTRVLDVGCGPGKFCLVGALTTAGHFTGVEQREPLGKIARSTLKAAGITQVELVCGNITAIDFSRFDAFYLFNPFEENLETLMKIDDSLPLSGELYDHYIEHVAGQLAQAPLGTRVATYCGACEEVPMGYGCVTSDSDSQLKFWEKIRNYPVRYKSSQARATGARHP